VAIAVPTPEQEAVRDLCRARAALVADRNQVRQRLGKFLLRHDRVWRDGSALRSTYGQLAGGGGGPRRRVAGGRGGVEVGKVHVHVHLLLQLHRDARMMAPAGGTCRFGQSRRRLGQHPCLPEPVRTGQRRVRMTSIGLDEGEVLWIDPTVHRVPGRPDGFAFLVQDLLGWGDPGRAVWVRGLMIDRRGTPVRSLTLCVPIDQPRTGGVRATQSATHRAHDDAGLVGPPAGYERRIFE
jgi:hypothetical protein